MARNETDREDLIREAVALQERVELEVAGFDELVTIGFRSNRAMSIFVDQDPVFQFDPDGRLRRAFVQGLLYRSQHNTLARMRRERSETRTMLLRDDLSTEELEQFRASMLDVLKKLRNAIALGQAVVSRSVPESLDLLPQILNSLDLVLKADPWLSVEIRRRV